MKEEQAREVAKTKCHEEAMTRFRIADEDLTPVIQAARFGFERGMEYANRWTYLPELPTEYTAVLVTVTNGTVTLAVVTKDQKFLNVDGDPFTKYPVIAWRELPEPADIR